MKLVRCCFLLVCFLLPSAGFATTVNVAVPSFSMSLVAFMAAKEKGYYRQEGLDVNFVLMPAAIASRALIAGNVDFATVGGSALTASLGGAPLRLLFSSFNRSLFWLYSRPEITDVKELKGKKIGVSSIGSGPDSMLRDLLRSHGLQGGKDVAILAVGVDSSRYASLANNLTDAVVLSTPYNFTAQDAGFKELVSFVKHDWIELQGCIVTREAMLKSNPALVEKYTLATLKGLLERARQSRGDPADHRQHDESEARSRGPHLRSFAAGDDEPRRIERGCAIEGDRARREADEPQRTAELAADLRLRAARKGAPATGVAGLEAVSRGRIDGCASFHHEGHEEHEGRRGSPRRRGVRGL